MDIPQETLDAEREILEDARHPNRRRLRRALSRDRRGQQVVTVVAVAAAGLPVGAPAAGVPASATHSVVAAKTVASGQDSASAIVLTAAEKPVAPQAIRISDGLWRDGLIASASHVIGSGVSRSGLWSWLGEGNHGPQCAAGQALIVMLAEQHLHLPSWVQNPRVPSAYPEQDPRKIWRVDGDGSWEQWAINNGRWHPMGDGYKIKKGDLGSYGYHIVMLDPHPDGTMWYYGVDDGSDLGDHYAQMDPSGLKGVIDMSLPKSLVSSGGQASPGAGQQAHRNGKPAAQATPSVPAPSTPAQSATLQSDNVPGGMAAPGGLAGNGGTTLGSAVPVSASPVVPGGIAAPALVVGVGYADQFHADQPQPAKAPKQANQPVRRYTRHNPPPPAQAHIPGDAAQQAFIKSVVPGAIAAQQRWGVPASVTIAQAIVESGWGQSGLAARDHNLFGIKGAGPAGTDKLPTQEFQNGHYVTVTAPFRVYHNVAESINDHGQLLRTSGYYGAALSAWARDHSSAGADAFANALTGVYATDPQYGSTLITTMHRFNLYQFNSHAATSGQASTPVRPVPRPAPANPVPGARLGNTGQQAPVQNDAPGGVAVPGSLPVGTTPAPAVAGGMVAPSLTANPTLTAQANGSGASPDVQLVADVTPAPWLNRGAPSRQSDPPASTEPMPWMIAPSEPPRNGYRAPAPASQAQPAPVRARLTAARQPVRPQPRTATSVDLTGFAPMHPGDGAKYIKMFKASAEDDANRAMYRAVSAATGVPWQIVATVALLKRPRGTEVLTLEQLVRRFAQLAWDVARVNVTGGRLTPRQLDAAYQAYGAKSQGGLRPSELTRLITVPLRGAKPK